MEQVTLALPNPAFEVEEPHACSASFSTRADFTSITSQYSLYCSGGHVKENVQMITLFVASSLSFLFVVLQDRFGSKNMLTWSFFLVAVSGFVCVVFLDGLAFKVAGVTSLWGFCDILLSLVGVYSNELLVEPFRKFYNVLCRVMFSIGAIFGTFMTLYLRDYRQIAGLYMSGYVVFMGLLLFVLPHSPSFLLKQSKIRELKKTITRIARLNNLPPQKLQEALQNLDNIVQSKPTKMLLTRRRSKTQRNRKRS